MISEKTRYTLDIILMAVFGSFVVYGVMREEVGQIVSNALLICFSCIGIK